MFYPILYILLLICVVLCALFVVQNDSESMGMMDSQNNKLGKMLVSSKLRKFTAIMIAVFFLICIFVSAYTSNHYAQNRINTTSVVDRVTSAPTG